MKQESFGNILIEDENNLTGNNTEFYKPSDILSSNTLNRAIEQIYEEDENSYEVLQNLAKMLWGQKANGILPDIYEEMDVNKITLSNFYNESNDYFIRIPTGAFIAKVNDPYSNYYKYLKEENNQYSRDFYIDNDHNAFIVFNRPNINLFERQLADHFNFNLNDEDNNIKINYNFINDREAVLSSNGNPTEAEIMAYNKNKSTIGRSISYTATISKTKYDYKSLDSGGIATTTEVENNTINIGNNVFDAVKNFANNYGNYLMKRDNKFSLEEIIPLPKDVNTEEIEYIIFFNPNTKNPIKEANKNTIAYYSYSNRFGIATADNYNLYITDNKAVKLFSLKLVNREDGGITTPEIVDGSLTNLLSKIDRTKLEIKNLNVINTINDLIIERKNTSYNISNAHIEEASGNISIGDNTLGYPLNNEADQDPTLFSQRFKTNIGNYNIAIGENSMRNTEKDPHDNIAIGKNSLINIGNGYSNIEIGPGAGTLIGVHDNINIGNNLSGLTTEAKKYNGNITLGQLNFSNKNNILTNNYIIGYNNNPSSLTSNNYIFGNGNDGSYTSWNYVIGQKNSLVLEEYNYILGRDNSGNYLANDYIIGISNKINTLDRADADKYSSNFVIGKENSISDSTKTFIAGIKNTANIENNSVLQGFENVTTNNSNTNLVGNNNTISENSQTYVLGSNNTEKQGIYIYTVGSNNNTIEGNNILLLGSSNNISANCNNSVIIGNTNKQATLANNMYIYGHDNNNIGSESLIVGNSNLFTSGSNDLIIGNKNTISGSNNIIVGSNYSSADNNSLVIKPIGFIKSFNNATADFFIKIQDVNNDVDDNAVLNAYNFELNVNNATFDNNVRIVKELHSDYNIAVSSWGINQSSDYTKITSWDSVNSENILSVPVTGTLSSFTNENLKTIKTFIGSGYNTSNFKNEFIVSIRENNGKNNDDKAFKMWLDYTNYNDKSNEKHLKFTVLGYDIDYTDYDSDSTNYNGSAGKIVKTLIDNGPDAQKIEGTLYLGRGLNVSGPTSIRQFNSNISGQKDGKYISFFNNDADTIQTDADIYAPSFIATSARSKKKNIKNTTHTHAVDEINKIKIVDFNFKTDINNENPKVGFIADDTDAIFATNKHNSMDIYNCVGMLLKAVQELSAENKQLKKEIESIK